MGHRLEGNNGAEARARLLQDVPIQTRRLNVNGIDTSVLEAGAGQPLVLLHGGIECGGVYWAPIIGDLAESYRLIIPDVPGLGESSPFPQVTADAFTDWFSTLLRLTTNERPMLVAHSLLGSFAARYAARHESRLSRLFIYGAPAVGPYRMPLRLIVTAIRFDLSPSERNNERFERFAFLDLDRTRRNDPEWFRAFSTYEVARAVVPHTKRTMRQLIRAGTKRVPDRELQRIEVPKALLWGRHDRMVPVRIAESASARLGWPLHVIDDAGHVPHLERPHAFVSALHDALA